MSEFERPARRHWEPEYPEEVKETANKAVEEIVLKATEMPEFQAAVANSKSGFTAIREVRALLQKHFPEIENIPETKLMTNESGVTRSPNPFGGRISNEFIIAKHIVELLEQK